MNFPTSKPALTGSRARYVLAAIVVVSPFHGQALAQSSGLEAYNSYVAGLEALGLNVQNGAIDYDAGSDILTITDQVLTFSGEITGFPVGETGVAADTTDTAPDQQLTDLSYSISMSAGTVTITGLSEEDGIFSSKSWIYSDDAEFFGEGEASGQGRMRFDGRMTGMTATDYTFEMPVLPEDDATKPASRWLPFLRAMLLTSYSEVLAPATAITFEAYSFENNPETKVLSGTLEMNGYRMADAQNGVIGSYSIDETTQTSEALDPDSGLLVSQITKQGKSEYETIDTGVLIDLLDPSVPVTGDEYTFFGYGRTVDYETTQDLGGGHVVNFKIDRTTLRDISFIKREGNLLGLIDSILSSEEPAPEDIISGVFQLYRSFGIADARVSGIQVDVTSPSDDESVSVEIKEMAMTDVNSDGIGEMIVVGLDAPDLPDGAAVKLDWAAIGDIEFADYAPMQSVIQNLIADPDYGEQNPLEVARAFVPWSFNYEIEGLDLTIPDAGRTQIGKSEFTISTTVPPIPTSLYAKNDGIRIPAASIDDAEAQEFLKVLGLEEIVWSDETRLYWDEATKDLRLERLMLEVEGVGTAEASAHFANVPKELFEDPEGQGQMALILAQFVNARISFVDDGVTAKGLAHVAQEQNIPESVFRAALAEQAAEATAPIQNAAFTAMVRNAVSDFLDKPGQLTVSLAPQQPVPLTQIFGALAAPQTLPSLLNVDVKAE